MPSNQKTIAAVSNPRTRQPPKKTRAPLTAEEQKAKREAAEKTQAEMDDAIQEWMSFTHAKAEELGQRFDKKARYFLDIFFQGGAHMINQHEKVNAYNAFKSEKAAECRENGEAKTVPELHRDYHEEYQQLTEEEKAELVQRFSEARAEPKIRRATPRARVQDVANTVRNMQMLLSGLAYRVGVEGFFVVVRNTAEFHMAPYWYFTSPELERYMPLAVRKRWDISEVGTKIEAFAVAGCDTMNLLRTSPQKAAFAKGEIRDMILKKLVSITGNANAVMRYVNFEEDIVHRYGIDLVGWTPDKFCNPSELTSSLPVLRTLLNALKSGDCKFIKLTNAELKARKEKYEADIAAGVILGKQRNPRSDIGQKRKRAPAAEDDDNNQEDHGSGESTDPGTTISTTPTHTTPYSVAEPTTPSAKRRKTTKATCTTTQKVGAKPKQPPKGKENTGRRMGRRDDNTTRKALARMKGGRVAGAYKSRAIISDDEDNTGVAITGPSGHLITSTAASASLANASSLLTPQSSA